MTSLYHRIRVDQCETQRSILKNSLSLASFAPDIFAYQLMKGPGYHAVISGELISIIKCTPVPVYFRKTETCFLEIPVKQNNQSYFITPLSRILVRRGTAVDCIDAIPTGFYIDSQWYSITPNLLKAPAPLTLNPSQLVQWNYEKIENLGTRGLYNDDDMEKLRDRLLTKAESAAVVNNIVRGATGNEIPDGSISFQNLLDKETLENMTTSAAKKAWNSFITFGSATAGLMGILFIMQMIKLVINTIIHGYTLYDIYGCSLHLAGAFLSSLTHLFVHLAGRRNRENDAFDPTYAEMRYRRPRTEDTPVNTIPETTPATSDTKPNEKHEHIDPVLLQRARETTQI